jgi:hypothetical protein
MGNVQNCDSGLTTLPPSMSRFSRQCVILNISKPCRPPRPVTGIALLCGRFNPRWRLAVGFCAGNYVIWAYVADLVLPRHDLFVWTLRPFSDGSRCQHCSTDACWRRPHSRTPRGPSFFRDSCTARRRPEPSPVHTWKPVPTPRFPTPRLPGALHNQSPHRVGSASVLSLWFARWNMQVHTTFKEKAKN